MAGFLTAVLIATALFLLAVNAFIIVARITGNARLAREVARTLSAYVWPLRLSADARRAQRQSHV